MPPQTRLRSGTVRVRQLMPGYGAIQAGPYTTGQVQATSGIVRPPPPQWFPSANTLSLQHRSQLWEVNRPVMTYDHILNIDREVQYVWRKKIASAGVIYIAIRYSSLTSNMLICNGITVAFSVMGAIIIMGSALFSALRAYALCRRNSIALLVLVLGSANAVPSIYAAVKNRATYDPGPYNLDTVCDVDFSQFLSLRKGSSRRRFGLTTALFQNGNYVVVGVAYFAALLVCNLLNLVFVTNVEVTLRFKRFMPPSKLKADVTFPALARSHGTSVILTCRFILDLFEASDGSRLEPGPTAPSHLRPSHPAPAYRNVGGGFSVTSLSQGVFDAGVTWHDAEDSESACSNEPDYNYELQTKPSQME
ncbi:uncharacterized protein BXZ73DRAFT_74869 [Epithele typhae]|uniref:uncharacterized protein n=1 Tax=Epithele typhae TaxID=378194 RepID=UPI0020088EB9|nr:uncharacterized protein BXZ73DRAFT_74869 [Epithele typhae]KAH9941667.1 hypothetical protein BXZ73DRAFT_74869 [Epithele typhae]